MSPGWVGPQVGWTSLEVTGTIIFVTLRPYEVHLRGMFLCTGASHGLENPKDGLRPHLGTLPLSTLPFVGLRFCT